METEKLFDVWAKRNPQWEIRYETSIIKNFTDYGRGQNNMRDDRGKILGAGYEIFIIAFFIGLYNDQRRPLNEDSTKCKTFGHEIKYWGNINSTGDRHPYPKLKEFIFIALVAKTDINLINLDKDEFTVRKAVDMLMQTMEEYANWGFHYIEDKLIDNPDYFFKATAFLEEFMAFSIATKDDSQDDDEEPESLD